MTFLQLHEAAVQLIHHEFSTFTSLNGKLDTMQLGDHFQRTQYICGLLYPKQSHYTAEVDGSWTSGLVQIFGTFFIVYFYGVLQ